MSISLPLYPDTIGSCCCVCRFGIMNWVVAVAGGSDVDAVCACMYVHTSMMCVCVCVLAQCLQKGFCWVLSFLYSQAAGLEVGDTLQQVDGVQLGSYIDGMETLDKQFGPVVLTALRKNGMQNIYLCFAVSHS